MQTTLLLDEKGNNIITDNQGEFLTNFVEMLFIISIVCILMFGQKSMLSMGFGFIISNRSTRRIGRSLDRKRNNEMLILQ